MNKLVFDLAGDLIFFSDSQDVEPIKELCDDAKYFDSFFVRLGDGEYAEVWGIEGIVPGLNKNATLIYGKEQNK